MSTLSVPNQSAPNASANARDSLTTALHSAVHRAAKQILGGVALLFTLPNASRAEGDPLQLRLAAGFGTPEEAQEAAQAVYPLADRCRDCRDVQRETAKPTPDGGKSESELIGFPVIFSNRVHGVLVAGSPSPVEEDVRRQLTMLCNTMALLLDQAALEAEVNFLHAQVATLRESGGQEEDKSPEDLLELSEALFAQDLQVIQNNEIMNKVERLKSDFIEKMSRELRTPLNSIIESIISVIANDGDSLSDHAQSLLRSALDDGNTFQRTLENILDLWRIRQDELTVLSQEVSVPEIVDEAIFSVQDSLGSKPVSIETELQDPFPRIKTDLAKLSQILFLLLDNAVKFTSAGKVTIRAHLVDGKLQCEVHDTGIGICSEDLTTIFDEFFQVDDTSSSQYRGSGLGLTLVSELLKLLDGSINVNSDVGRGSDFQIQLPVTPMD